MKLTTDFECGSGIPRELGNHHWRIETVADRCGYNKYFCFEIDAAEDRDPALLRVEIWPDPSMEGRSPFMSHFPSAIWHSTRDWQRWSPLRHLWEDSVKFHPDHIELTIPIQPGVRMQVASNWPCRYSDLLGWISQIEHRHQGQVVTGTLGKSHGGRDIPVLYTGSGQARFCVVAGQHPSEHSGVWASRGIVEYLLSNIQEARALRETFQVAVIPMLNVDGNVLGRSAVGLQDFEHNNSLDFEGAADGSIPSYTENALLWDWMSNRFPPNLLLHFHGYLGWRTFGEFPGDGLYVVPEPREEPANAPRRRIQQAVLDRLLFESSAHTGHFGTVGETPSAFLDAEVVKAFGSAVVCCEINAGTTGAAGQFRRGVEAFLAVAHAAAVDCPDELAQLPHPNLVNQ